MAEWQTIPIKEVYAGMYDGPHATPKPSGSGPIFLGIKNVGESGQLDLSDVRHISEEEYPRWIKRVEPRHGDIVFSYEATLNRYAMIPQGFRGCLGRRMALIRPDESKACGRFLYYYFFGQEWRNVIAQNTLIGSTVDRIPIAKFPDFPITIPPLPTQRKIAAILSAYDDLIENNLRRIKILEEMAQNLYREWFVKFRFPGHQHAHFTDSSHGMIPDGWEAGTLGTVSNVIPGYAFKSKDWVDVGMPVIKIKNIRPGNLIDTEQVDHVPEGILSSTHKKFWIHNGDILIAMTGATAGKVGKVRSRKSMLLNQRVAKIEPKDHFKEFVWCTVGNPGAEKRFYALADGAAQPNMSGSQIENLEILVPSFDLVSQFNDTVTPIINDVDNMILRNQTLRYTRDLLLPKLISGEVDVSELDINVPEEAAA